MVQFDRRQPFRSWLGPFKRIIFSNVKRLRTFVIGGCATVFLIKHLVFDCCHVLHWFSSFIGQQTVCNIQILHYVKSYFKWLTLSWQFPFVDKIKENINIPIDINFLFFSIRSPSWNLNSAILNIMVAVSSLSYSLSNSFITVPVTLHKPSTDWI